MMKRLLTVLVASGGLLASAWSATVSAPAPDFTLPASGGEQVMLSGLRGQVVMINFWATWCGPCRQEMPHLEALHQRYKDLGFTLLGINVEDDPAGARKWLDEHAQVTFPILFDARNEVSKLYEVVAMPSTVIVDRNGTIRHVHHGYQAGYEHEYQTQIRALLRE